MPRPRCSSLSYPYDPDLSGMLKVFAVTGLLFMLLPGTLVGVLNLLKISSAHASSAADAGWIQAHGHAQMFGWLGTFILGIGYYAIPRLRLSAWSARATWSTYALWVAGVTIRWAVGTWPWHWRVLFPLAGLLELAAVVIFATSVYLARPRSEGSWRESVKIITAAGAGFVAAVAVNAWESMRVAMNGTAPVFDHDFNQRYLVLMCWGFVVPFIWGFASRWIPPLLGLKPTRKRLLLPAVGILFAGVIAAMAGFAIAGAALLLAAAFTYAMAMRLFERPAKEAKLRGVHASTPHFIRCAFVWSVVAGVLGLVASMAPLPNGYAGASRHALTVGFFSAAVFTIGPRVLPAFFNVVRLWSPRLMAASLVLLNIGCVTRVVSQVLAYGHMSGFAWKTLPLSAVIEMVAVALFALNMAMTLTTGSPLELLAQSASETAAVEA